MKNIDIILRLLNEKKSLFLEVEQLTNDMITRPVSEISELLDRRGKLLDSAVLIDQKIIHEIGNDAILRSVLNNTCDASALSQNYSKLFELSLKIKAIINRIRNNESGVRERIDFERNNALVKIEQINKSGIAVAQRYKQSVETGFTQKRFFDREKKI